MKKMIIALMTFVTLVGCSADSSAETEEEKKDAEVIEDVVSNQSETNNQNTIFGNALAQKTEKLSFRGMGMSIMTMNAIP